MKITPQHGWMYVELGGWFKQLKSDSVELINTVPEPLDVITTKVLSVEPSPSEDNKHDFKVGDIVMVRYAAFVSVEVTVSEIEPKTTTVRGLIPSQVVMAVTEDYAN